MSAPFYVLTFDLAARGDTGPSFGTFYDMINACHACGTGARQIGPLRIQRRALPAKRRMAQSYQFDLMIADSLADELIEAGLNSVNLRPVHDVKTDTPLPWKQIYPAIIFPAFLGQSSGYTLSDHRKERQCRHCRRDGYYNIPNVPFHPVYDESQIDDLLASMVEPKKRAIRVEELDAAVTWECFGTSVKPGTKYERHSPRYDDVVYWGLAKPQILVNRKIAGALKASGKRAARLEPVTILARRD